MEKVQYVFVDSGIGGLPYLSYLRSKDKTASAAYIADTKHFPYGTKTTEELQELAVNLTEKLIAKFQPEIIIIACNTLSLASLKTLREKFSLPFVGTVPAVKLAAETACCNKILLIGSEKSVQDEYTKELIEKFSSPERFVLKAKQSLIQKIENGLMFQSTEIIENELQPIIDECVALGADCLVLACTHFLIVEDYFKKLGRGKVKVIESLNGVIKQTLKLSPKLYRNDKSYFYTTSLVSAKEADYYKKICSYFHLQFGGQMI